MLYRYQSDRDAASNQYTNELDTQHQFARQQLSQQLYENQLKALTEATKTPGALDIISSSPQYSGVLGGADPSVVGGVAQHLTNLQNAEQFQKAGAGLASADSAGWQVGNADASRLAGAPVVSGLSRAERVANIGANARIAAAGIRGGQEKQPGITETLPVGPNGEIRTGSFGGRTGLVTNDQINAWKVSHGYASAPVVQPPPVDAPPPTSGKTSLPPAKTEGTGGTGPGVVRNTAPGAAQLQAKAQAYVEGPLRQTDPAGYADVKAAQTANGGKPVLQQGKDGTLTGIVGKSGKVY